MTEINPEEQSEILRVSRLISIGFSTSETLAAHVVVYRTLNLDKELALICMRELARRRLLGEDFDYETYIEEKIKTIPQMKGINLLGISNKMIFSQKYFAEDKK
jgi:hypothetical protein